MSKIKSFIMRMFQSMIDARMKTAEAYIASYKKFHGIK